MRSTYRGQRDDAATVEAITRGSRAPNAARSEGSGLPGPRLPPEGSSGATMLGVRIVDLGCRRAK